PAAVTDADVTDASTGITSHKLPHRRGNAAIKRAATCQTSYSSIMKAVVISAPMTGSGKSTVTLGLLAALRSRGIAVQPFKVGPDFIDPGLHEIAAGVGSHNLDGWMLSREANEQLFVSAMCEKDVAIVEGV